MRENADLAYDLEVPCAFGTVAVPRTLALVKRIEQSFGPIGQLSAKLEHYGLPLAQLAFLVSELHADLPASDGPPSRKENEEWLFREGIHKASKALAAEVMTLVMGNEVLAKVIARKRGLTNGSDVVGPFAPTAASSGHTGS